MILHLIDKVGAIHQEPVWHPGLGVGWPEEDAHSRCWTEQRCGWRTEGVPADCEERRNWGEILGMRSPRADEGRGNRQMD